MLPEHTSPELILLNGGYGASDEAIVNYALENIHWQSIGTHFYAYDDIISDSREKIRDNRQILYELQRFKLLSSPQPGRNAAEGALYTALVDLWDQKAQEIAEESGYKDPKEYATKQMNWATVKGSRGNYAVYANSISEDDKIVLESLCHHGYLALFKQFSATETGDVYIAQRALKQLLQKEYAAPTIAPESPPSTDHQTRIQSRNKGIDPNGIAPTPMR